MNERAARAYREFLEAYGLDLAALGMTDTPRRVADLYTTLLAGTGKSTAEVWGEVFTSDYEGLVTVTGLHFHSLCEHHMLPFFGSADIVYLPRDGRVAGLSKVEALLQFLSRQPQLQERLTEQIVTAFMTDLSARGAWVRLRARHLCMTMKGESSPEARITTVRAAGELAPGTAGEARVLAMLGGNDAR
ncbi:MAG: GTP cyclohydrolase I [Veillonellaceae bacterium]|nr:GTP cyclohydrolase I [Veillonellaceae bacterium]